MFAMPERLKKDCIVIGRFELSCLLLMNDSHYPWFILVPMRENVSEFYELSEPDQQQLTQESTYLAQRLAERFNADKMNVATLGNIEPQLHIHHIVRYKKDPAWPHPVWGRTAAKPYTEQEIMLMLSKLKQILTKNFAFL